jgi:hypothetical protein
MYLCFVRLLADYYSPKRETIDIVHAIYEIFYLHVHLGHPA